MLEVSARQGKTLWPILCVRSVGSCYPIIFIVSRSYPVHEIDNYINSPAVVQFAASIRNVLSPTGHYSMDRRGGRR